MGPFFARMSASVARLGEARFTYYEDFTNLEGMFTEEVRFGLEMGVRL
jgi:hypothetical protein